MSEWKPIESAPIEPFNKEKWFMAHSPRLLLWLGKYADIGTYDFTERGKGRWLIDGRLAAPSHWMPLPTGPTEAENG